MRRLVSVARIARGCSGRAEAESAETRPEVVRTVVGNRKPAGPQPEMKVSYHDH
jgi:hypothetical protein